MISESQWQGALDTINEMMQGASPVGAYCLGMATSSALREGWLLTRDQTTRLVQCDSVEEAEALLLSIAAETKTNEPKGTT